MSKDGRVKAGCLLQYIAIAEIDTVNHGSGEGMKNHSQKGQKDQQDILDFAFILGSIPVIKRCLVCGAMTPPCNRDIISHHPRTCQPVGMKISVYLSTA